jgi:hypothetical protein
LTVQRLCGSGTVQQIKNYTPEISLHLMWLISGYMGYLLECGSYSVARKTGGYRLVANRAVTRVKPKEK